MEDSNMPITLPNYAFVMPFERDFVLEDAKGWMNDTWHTGFYFSTAYIAIIFGIKHLMTDYKPFTLRTPLLLWNLTLAIFSIVAFCRTAPEFWHTLTNYGLYHSLCVPSSPVYDKVSSFWSFMFVLSKLPEFGDTIFIVLRKQPLIFLHWYHHILTLLYSWYAFKEFNPSSRWFIVMNCLVHSVMYSYYAFKAMKFRIPKFISVLITSSQISQMAVGCYVSFKSWQYKLAGISCSVSYENVTVSTLMYLSYLVLFVRFFYMSYLSKPRQKKSVKSQ